MFKVGDIITGTSDNGYIWTNNKAIMRVVHVDNEYEQMDVEIISHTNEQIIGSIFEVWNSPKRFRLYDDKLISFVKSLIGGDNK